MNTEDIAIIGVRDNSSLDHGGGSEDRGKVGRSERYSEAAIDLT